jgi:hypothetical protein
MSKTNASFINVEGGDLESRLAAAHSRARGGSASFYWAAYKFTARPGVSVDAVLSTDAGLPVELGGVITGNVGQYETRNLGVFLLYADAAADAPTRVEVYNLDRQRDFDGLPVYWLGEAGEAESLGLLEGLLRRRATGESAGGKLAEAVALHEGGRAEELLAELARGARLVSARAVAAFWLGRIGLNLPLAEEVAADGREDLAVRQQAVMGIGKSRAPGALDALRRLLEVVGEHSLREAVVNAVAKSRQPGAAELLKSVADGSDDAGLRRRAQMQLLKASGAKGRAKEGKRDEGARRDRSWRPWQ